MRIGDFEDAPGNIEFSPRCRLDSAATEIDDGIAANDAQSEVGITDGRQICDRPRRRSAGLDIDR